MPKNMQYRREVDGLRALAVVPVVLFHAGFERFSGGFVGVDVFFVISGYLITSIILEERQSGTFSLLKFYERRARRILPALFLVLAACVPFAWLWMAPQEMKEFSHNLIAVVLFASNILLSATTGYFDSAAELRPLLHTWSLAVEEQFYLLYPLLLLITWRLGRGHVAVMLTVIALASLGAAQWSSSHAPTAAFYLLPTRGWELLIGALVAFYLFDQAASRPTGRHSDLWAGLGLVMVIYSVLAFDEHTPFPSVYALVPTIGTALIILFSHADNRVGGFLGNRAFVFVGLISYSFYLWHQPLFAFGRYANLDLTGTGLHIELILLALLLAYLSWRFVEVPFRNKQLFSRRTIFLSSASTGVAIIAVGLMGGVTNGFQNRIAGEQAELLAYFENESPGWQYYTKIGIPEKFRYDCNFMDIDKWRFGDPTYLPRESIPEDCYTRSGEAKKTVFIWGDSHAQQLNYGLRQALPNDWQILQVASSGCRPRAELSEKRDNYCAFSNWFAFKSIREIKPDVVIVGRKIWRKPPEMKELSDRLLEAGVGKVIFTGPTPQWTRPLPQVVASHLLPNPPYRTQVGFDRTVERYESRIRASFPESDRLRYVSLLDYFCDVEGCLVYYGKDVKAGITSWDYGHLTPLASYHLAKDLLASVVMQ